MYRPHTLRIQSEGILVDARGYDKGSVMTRLAAPRISTTYIVHGLPVDDFILEYKDNR